MAMSNYLVLYECDQCLMTLIVGYHKCHLELILNYDSNSNQRSTNLTRCFLSIAAGSGKAMKAIQEGFQEWSTKTCIRFKKRTNEAAYVSFFKGSGLVFCMYTWQLWDHLSIRQRNLNLFPYVRKLVPISINIFYYPEEKVYDESKHRQPIAVFRWNRNLFRVFRNSNNGVVETKKRRFLLS